MRYEEKKLSKILSNLGINHKLSSSILPYKHPYILELIGRCDAYDISYLYVSITDSVIVHHKDKNANIICNTLISPDKGGMSVLIIQNNIENVKIYRDIIFSNLETIIPLDAEYKIIGIL